MDIKWRLYLYSYKGRYGCAHHSVAVTAENENLNIIHAERTLSTCVSADGGSEECFSGVYGVDAYLLSFENGKILRHEQLKTKDCPDVMKPKPISGGDYPDNKHYYFDKYDIFMEGSWMMCCRDRFSRHIIWKKNTRHYLYTDIECHDGILYFGTQGNGGIFYALSAADGSTVFALRNCGMHPEFFWVDGNVLYADPKGVWNLVSPKTGELIAHTFCGDIKYRNGNTFVVLCEKFNRSAKLYDAGLLCAGL